MIFPAFFIIYKSTDKPTLAIALSLRKALLLAMTEEKRTQGKSDINFVVASGVMSLTRGGTKQSLANLVKL